VSKPAGERYTVAVDFDGVLHSYTSPWVNATTIPDPPVPGAIEWLTVIAHDFDVVIFTTRGETIEGQVAVLEWLRNHGLNGIQIKAVTARKPPALVYIDDRAWRFEGTFPTADEIHRAKPWNKR
jgi:5'(3')-deoxyribonucleotidase